jgi:hypothetical protein
LLNRSCHQHSTKPKPPATQAVPGRASNAGQILSSRQRRSLLPHRAERPTNGPADFRARQTPPPDVPQPPPAWPVKPNGTARRATLIRWLRATFCTDSYAGLKFERHPPDPREKRPSVANFPPCGACNAAPTSGYCVAFDREVSFCAWYAGSVNQGNPSDQQPVHRSLAANFLPPPIHQGKPESQLGSLPGWEDNFFCLI